MSFTVLIHIANADPIVAEMDSMPSATATHIVCTNPRARDGKIPHYIDPEAIRFIFPWHRITFVEAYPSEEDRAEVETFFRD